MIRAEHSRFHIWISVVYTKIALILFFRNVRFIGEVKTDNNLAILMIANHFSWWDGFFQLQLNLKFFKKKYHFMMLEKQMRKDSILRKIGASSIEKGSRSILDSLKYVVEVIQNPENLFLFFPEGKIKSIYTEEFKFEKGAINYILKKVTFDFQFVFNVNLIDYSSFKRPEVSVYYKTHKINSNTTATEIEKDYNDFVKECKEKQREE
jgi:1-acyl-sn-glycerol-3-phosphate acyltransferase